jgi:hypothetical protein
MYSRRKTGTSRSCLARDRVLLIGLREKGERWSVAGIWKGESAFTSCQLNRCTLPRVAAAVVHSLSDCDGDADVCSHKERRRAKEQDLISRDASSLLGNVEPYLTARRHRFAR